MTAHGSARAALLVGGAAVTDDGFVGLDALEAATGGVVACGVFATVESPEPQPVNVAATNAVADTPISGAARRGSDHTTGTVPRSGCGLCQAWPCQRDHAPAAPPNSRNTVHRRFEAKPESHMPQASLAETVLSVCPATSDYLRSECAAARFVARSRAKRHTLLPRVAAVTGDSPRSLKELAIARWPFPSSWATTRRSQAP